MTTNDNDLFSGDSDRIIADGLKAAERIREQLRQIDQLKAEQPARLEKARSDADQARGWALIEDNWDRHVTALPAYGPDGTRNGNSLTLPSLAAKELWGARLAFDLLDCGDDFDQVDEVISRNFSMVNGDTGLVMLLMSSALSTIATLVVPQLLDEIERQASNWDERVRLCEARAKAWNARVDEIPTEDEAAEDGVRPVDAFDLGAAALDADEHLGDEHVGDEDDD